MKLAFLHQSTDQRRELILHGSILRTLLLLATPTLMMSVVQSLMPLADGLFINNVAGTLVASAVTYSGPVINMTVALAQGLGVAAMAIIGQTNGAGDYEQVKHVATQTIVFCFAMGVVMAPVLVGLAFPISWRVSPEIQHNVFLYIALYAIVLPFSFLEASYNAVKNSTGHPEAPFIRMVLMLVFKILFNVVFIVWLRLEVVGCVLASFGANLVIGVWMFYELFVQESEDRLTIRGFRFDWPAIRELVRVGIPSMLTNVMLNLGFFLINNEVEKYGTAVLTGQGIANNITTVCFNLPGAFGSAVTTMVSMNVGAGQGDKAKKSTLFGSILSAITAVAIIAIVVPLSGSLTVLFTKDAAVLEMANTALHIYTYSVVGFGVCMVIQGAFIGLGRTKVPLLLGLLRVWALRYVFILCTETMLGVYSVYWGNLFSNYAAALIAVLLILPVKWQSVIRHR